MKQELSFESIRNNKEIQTYLEFTDAAFAQMGYKEHGQSHALYSAEIAEQILKYLGYTKREQELAKIAAYLHDIGNIISKHEHDQSSAVMFLNFVDNRDFDEEVYAVTSAIGCHEDKDTDPVSPIAAALVLGDKTDVRHERLRTESKINLDKHSRVIAACQKVDVVVDREEKTIALRLKIDTSICSVMDYFEIFMARTNYCRRASRVLGCNFELYINKDKFL
ncbi:MAG: HD domain-containing protein [Endomicrobium sp.]|jgi:metal-dependent HD superfamily phosphatase/phosphodiesterase|nr:HD domain-containing protein [Endomicrobium sp.]